jgi:2-dehydro-3-deoxygluconokinase
VVGAYGVAVAGLDVVCLGETMTLLAPEGGTTLRRTETLRLAHGGAESNVAVSLARLGDTVAWCSRLGADPLGDRIVADVSDAGVDTSRVIRVCGARTGLYVKDPGPGGTTVWYYRAGSAASGMDRTDVDRARTGAPRLLHLSGITPALSASCADAVSYALSGTAPSVTPAPGAESEVTTSFDVNYRPALWPSVDAAGAVLLDLARRADLVFVGLDEAHSLWRTDTAEQVRELLPQPMWLVVKEGAVRASAFGQATAVHAAAPTVDVVEAVGAGDAFAAGWLHGWLHDLSPAVCLHLGHLVAGTALRSPTDHGVFPADPGELVRRAVTLAATHETVLR